MIDALVRALTTIFTKPAVLLPALIALVISIGVFAVFGSYMFVLVYQIAVLEQVPIVSLPELPFALIYTYPFEILMVGIMLAIGLLLQTWLLFAYSDFAQALKKKKASVLASIKRAASAWRSIIVLFVFFLLVSALVFLLYLIVFWIATFDDVIGLVLAVLLTIGVVYVIVKLVMTVPIMAIGNKSLKEGLQLSWEFSSRHFWGTLVVLAVAGIAVVPAIEIIRDFIAGLLVDEVQQITVYAVFSLVTTTYSALVVPLYYINKAKA